MEQTTGFHVVYSAALGGRIEMTVEPVYRVGQLAGVGLLIRSRALFD